MAHVADHLSFETLTALCTSEPSGWALDVGTCGEVASEVPEDLPHAANRNRNTGYPREL